MNLEDVSCPICGRADSDPLFIAENQRLPGSGLTFAVRTCRTCALALTSPRPSAQDLDALYGREYFSPRESSLAGWITRATARERANFLQKLRRGGALLDVGCGTGSFLLALPSPPFQLTGLEPYHGLFTAVPERIRSCIRFESFDRANFPASTFDIVTLWHVLEHLPQPLEALRTCREILKPGGHLVLEVPNLASIEARWLGRHWYHLDVPFHLWHFTPRTLQAILEKAGFVVQSVHTSSLQPVLLINYLSMGATSIESWTRERFRRLPSSNLAKRVLRLTGLGLCAAEHIGLFFSTPALRMVARKEP